MLVDEEGIIVNDDNVLIVNYSSKDNYRKVCKVEKR